MTWLLLAFASAALLGCYDTLKKVALKDNAVIPVLFFNTLFSQALVSFADLFIMAWPAKVIARAMCTSL